MRYTSDLGCRYRNVPHDITIVSENPRVKLEVCMICNKRFRWNKGYKGRTENNEYLKVHVRNFAQKHGPTKRIYNRIYNPESFIISV